MAVVKSIFNTCLTVILKGNFIQISKHHQAHFLICWIWLSAYLLTYANPCKRKEWKCEYMEDYISIFRLLFLAFRHLLWNIINNTHVSHNLSHFLIVKIYNLCSSQRRKEVLHMLALNKDEIRKRTRMHREIGFFFLFFTALPSFTCCNKSCLADFFFFASGLQRCIVSMEVKHILILSVQSFRHTIEQLVNTIRMRLIRVNEGSKLCRGHEVNYVWEKEPFFSDCWKYHAACLQQLWLQLFLPGTG